jgi:transcription initiation factor TFIIIB Brf1 subunit/transcription initiation factor TFIIB
MRLVCPECKNEIDISTYTDMAEGSIVECNHCGITLEIKEISENIGVEIVDEGK